MTPLQPYRKFEVVFLNQLIIKGDVYLVSQSYIRANAETDHSKKPVLFTPYKSLKEAVQHYQYLKQKEDKLAAYVDIRNKIVTVKIVNTCNGNSDKIPYLSLVGNVQYINNYISRHYHRQIRSWVKKNKEEWIIREHNSLQPSFRSEMGEPMIHIAWGSQNVMVSLAEIERL